MSISSLTLSRNRDALWDLLDALWDFLDVLWDLLDALWDLLDELWDLLDALWDGLTLHTILYPWAYLPCVGFLKSP